MTTILLIWYALWWFFVAGKAISDGSVTCGAAIFILITTPIITVMFPFILIYQTRNKILWSKKQ